jgi:hypothetical protein
MKFLHGLFGFVIFILLLAIGAGLVYGATYGYHTHWMKMLDLLKTERMAVLGAGASIVLLLLLYILTMWQRSDMAAQFISYNGRSGKVSICIKAVRDFVQKTSDEFAAITSMHPVLNFHHGGLDVDLDLRVTAGTQIPELCRMLQERVTERLHEELGLQDVRHVRVTVREIIGKAGERLEKAQENVLS